MTTSNVQIASQELSKRLNRLLGVSATNLCTHCGWCIEACHVYQSTKDPTKSPVAKAELVRKVLKKDNDWLSKIFPWWTGAKELTEEDLDGWLYAAFRDCTLCERCVVNCPMGVETPAILGAARGALSAIDKMPEILEDLTEIAIAREETIEDYLDFFKTHIKLFEGKVQEKLHNPAARIPINEEADILYFPLSGEHTIVPPAVIFNTVGASWTMSLFEASNYAFFMGDTGRTKQIVERILKEATRLNVKEIVVTECGHAFSVLRWEAPKWFGDKYNFRVRSILEVYDEYLSKGLIKLDPSKNTDPVTYHDPCNIGRKGGVFEEPRRLLKASAEDYRDMTPNRVQSFCCGGGSGLVACEEWRDSRLQYGKVKADQIRATGARKVVTACDNCLHQIKELGEHYDLDISVSNVSQQLVDSLVVE